MRHVAIKEARNGCNYFSGKPMASLCKCSVNNGILLKGVSKKQSV
jgi:hypothetical protein